MNGCFVWASYHRCFAFKLSLNCTGAFFLFEGF